MKFLKAWTIAILCLATGITVVVMVPYLTVLGIGILAFILVKIGLTEVDDDNNNKPPE